MYGSQDAQPRSTLKEVPIRLRVAIRGTLVGFLALAASACFRDRDADSPEISAAERAAFAAPADSTLTPDQVERYLRTMLAQFDLLAAEAPAMRRRIQSGELGQGEQPGAPMKRWSDFLTATYVRAARRADASPAEMEYVGERMKQVSGYLAARQAQASGPQMAALLRQQAAAMRGSPGVSTEHVDEMLRSADDAERQTAQPPPPSVAQNLDVLHTTHGNVTDEMWIRITRVSGGVGLMALGDMADTTVSGPIAQIRDLRELYTQALENRAPPTGRNAPAP
jgi:hypothetical protein